MSNFRAILHKSAEMSDNLFPYEQLSWFNRRVPEGITKKSDFLAEAIREDYFERYISYRTLSYFESLPRCRKKREMLTADALIACLREEGYVVSDPEDIYETAIREVKQYTLSALKRFGRDVPFFRIRDVVSYGKVTRASTEIGVCNFSVFLNVSYWTCDEVLALFEILFDMRERLWKPQFKAFCLCAYDFRKDHLAMLRDVKRYLDKNFGVTTYRVYLDSDDFPELDVYNNKTYARHHMVLCPYTYKDRLGTFRHICETFTRADADKLPSWVYTDNCINMHVDFFEEFKYIETNPAYFEKKFTKDW